VGEFFKIIGMSFAVLLSSAFEAVLPLVILTVVFVLIDCISAWRLSRRMSKTHYNKDGKTSDGKFKSSKMGKTVLELVIIIPTGLLLAYFVQMYLFEGANLRLPQIYSGLIIFWQLWSILENESSCSDKKWAKILQKIMVDKTERHFDVDLSELRCEDSE